MTYTRFVVSEIDEDSGKRQGIFQALYELKEADALHGYELDRFQEVLVWFNKSLREPMSFSRSQKFHAHNKAISWFKKAARQHIDEMRELAAILEEHGFHVDVIHSERPGYIDYEDQYQITAVPFKETNA